ncbi:sulfate/molybdate ABC transporter ATP-binding protein [Methylocella tundrae]|uniref:Sulfate/thiosulfate import ATP-binding protein CysA n=1 Tax=Methylocella tundrae TaxID=227605 RepID=A0A4U8YZU8_METTU|nr:sulfate/molybdate ABC transporter ATP-binding protein [Methylocella tundrae]WPP05286.1 sulfate/molybdate ABC transporter ATP-binding protein [Methylocella tundrae]VFU07635.1 Sulfate/thiosulfate import ATP-binding protein CysA [Methylocella tundrae]
MQIRAVDIVKSFPAARRAALEGVSLTVGSGELVALLGPSGGGKTTLLRIIAGLDIPDAGKVFFGDEDASQKTVQERRVGFVFQSYALFKHLTVEENVSFGLDVRERAQRPPKAEIRKRALELLDLVQLGGLEKRRPAQLSGGQRQRVALARALAVEPRVLLLDEPFGALDAKVRRELRSWLRELHAQTGHTTIFVTHDQDEALELADRVAVLNGGRIEQIGTPDEIYDHPASAFVNSFIGEATALRAHLRDGQVFIGDHQVALPASNRQAASGAGEGRLFVRPQDIAIGDAGPGALQGEILSVRRSGPTRRAEIAIPCQASSIEVDTPASAVYRPGEKVPVRFLRGTFFLNGESAAPAGA